MGVEYSLGNMADYDAVMTEDEFRATYGQGPEYDAIMTAEEYQQRYAQPPQADEASWLETLSMVGAPMAVGISDAVAGGAEAIGDLGDFEWLQDWAQQQRRYGDVVTEKTRQYLNLEPGGTKETVMNIAGRGLPMVAAMVGSGGTALPALGTMAAQNFGERYGELKDYGAESSEAGAGALGSTAVNLLLDRVGLGRAFQAARPLRSKVLQTAAIDPVMNALGEAGDIGIDALAADRMASPEEIRQRLKTGVVAGATMSPAMAAGAHLGQRLNARGGADPQLEVDNITQQMKQLQSEPETLDKPDGIGETLKTESKVVDGDTAASERKMPEPLDDVAEDQTADVQRSDTEPVPSEPTPPPRKSKFVDESGAIRTLPQQLAADSVDAIRDRFTPEGVDEVWEGFENVRTQRTADSEKFMEGRFGNFRIPGVSKLAAPYRQAFVFPKTLAEKFSNYRPVFETGLNLEGDVHAKAADLHALMEPYFKLRDRSRVDKFLLAARRAGPGFEPSAANLKKLGLSKEEAEAFRSARTGMDRALGMLEEALVAKSKGIEDPAQRLEHVEKVKDFVEELRAVNYVPFGRFGDLFVHARNKEGETIHFSLHEKKSDMNNTVRELAGDKDVEVVKGQLKRPPKEAYDALPMNLIGAIGRLDPDAYTKLAEDLPPRGFTKHLVEAKLTKGEEADLARSFADYIVGISQYAAHQAAKPRWDSALAGIDPKVEPELYGHASRYRDYMEGSRPEMQGLRQLFANYYLGGNPKSAAVNLSQTLTMTYPKLTKYMGAGEAKRVYANSMKQALRWMKNKNSIKGELGKDLKKALSEGIVNEAQYRQLTGRARGKNPDRKSVSDVSMILFDTAERLNRSASFIAGWKAADKMGLKGEARLRHARDFVNDTQFVYGKSNRPEIARGRKAAFFTFRAFAGNWLRALRNHLTKEDWPVAARMLGGMATVGGMRALPLVSLGIAAMQQAGVADPEKEVKEMLGDGKMANAFMYGLPELAGQHVSGAVSIGELAPDFERGVDEALTRFIGGVPYDFFIARPSKFKWLWQDMDNLGRAIEALLPEGLRNPAVSLRALREDGWRAPDLEPYVEDPTPYELAGKALGFTPSRLAQAYRDRHSAYMLDQEARENENINFKIARAIFRNDKKRVRELVTDINKKNEKLPEHKKINISKTGIKHYLLDMRNPEAGRLKRTPVKARDKMAELLDVEDWQDLLENSSQNLPPEVLKLLGG